MIERSMVITTSRHEWCTDCGATHSERCPDCGSSDVLPLVFGMAGPEMESAEARGEIALGGCAIRPVDARCVRCGHEWTRGTSPFSPKSLARTESGRDGIGGVLGEMADRLGEFVPVVDRETLDAVVGSMRSGPDTDDPSGIPSGIDRCVDVVCSPECRDRLLREGQSAAVSVWHRDSNGIVRSVAGTGPFRRMPSAVIVIDEDTGDLVVAVSTTSDESEISGLQVVDDPTDLWDRAVDEIPFMDLSELDASLDREIELWSGEEPTRSEPEIERHFVEVEITVDGSVRSIAAIPTDRKRPRRVTFNDGDVTVEALAQRLEQIGCRIMSVPRAAKLIQRGLVEVALATEQGSSPRCLHPRLERGRCCMCSREYRVESLGSSVPYPLRPVYVLRRGLGHRYRWSTGWTRTSEGSGESYLERALQIPEVTANVAPVHKMRPMVAGYTPAFGVIVYEDEARPLAEMYDVVRTPCTVSGLLGVSSSLGISWMRDALDQWIDMEDDPDGIRIASGQYRPDAIIEIDHDFWHGEEGYGPWPRPDDYNMTLSPACDVAVALGVDLDDLEDEFDVDLGGAEGWIRYGDIKAVVEALERAGAPIRLDDDLIRRASAEY